MSTHDCGCGLWICPECRPTLPIPKVLLEIDKELKEAYDRTKREYLTGNQYYKWREQSRAEFLKRANSGKWTVSDDSFDTRDFRQNRI